MIDKFPFTETDQKSLQELNFNSNVSTPARKFNPEKTIDDKLKLMLSYSKQSPWYAYTHPNDNEHDFFTADEAEDTMTLRQNFDYYDIDEFKKVKKTLEYKEVFGYFSHKYMFSPKKY